MVIMLLVFLLIRVWVMGEVIEIFDFLMLVLFRFMIWQVIFLLLFRFFRFMVEVKIMWFLVFSLVGLMIWVVFSLFFRLVIWFLMKVWCFLVDLYLVFLDKLFCVCVLVIVLMIFGWFLVFKWCNFFFRSLVLCLVRGIVFISFLFKVRVIWKMYLRFVGC